MLSIYEQVVPVILLKEHLYCSLVEELINEGN